MINVIIIGKEPIISVICKSLNDCVVVKDIIFWDETFRINNKRITVSKGDVVVLAFLNDRMSDVIRKWLIDEYQELDTDKIVSYSELKDNILPVMRADRLFYPGGGRVEV